MKRIVKVLTNYRFKGVANYSKFAHDVITSLSSNTYFPNGSILAQPIVLAVNTVDTFVTNHPQMDPTFTAELEVLRENLLKALSDAAGEVNRLQAGNEAALLSSGFELTKAPKKRTPPLAAGKCEIVDGTTSGSMCIRLKRPTGTMNIKWYYTTDPTLPLSQWTEHLELTDELTITGLTPGTRLYAKVACLNSASTSDNLNFAEAAPRYVQ
jgi:hypothetical protein